MADKREVSDSSSVILTIIYVNHKDAINTIQLIGTVLTKQVEFAYCAVLTKQEAFDQGKY